MRHHLQKSLARRDEGELRFTDRQQQFLPTHPSGLEAFFVRQTFKVT